MINKDEVERRISHYLILYEGKGLTRRQTIAKILHLIEDVIKEKLDEDLH
ncbi:hypothetical protein LCGC14_0732820 [marine sediment metagenome]|uniref:Uncharacterized protein n=1 Tax=marine sediment metagenome TaxID=412755 RepID=A0A0F9TGA9_9ZZZZ